MRTQRGRGGLVLYVRTVPRKRRERGSREHSVHGRREGACPREARDRHTGAGRHGVATPHERQRVDHLADRHQRGAYRGTMDPGVSFSWSSFGFPVTSTVYEVTDHERVRWDGTASGIYRYSRMDLRGDHTRRACRHQRVLQRRPRRRGPGEHATDAGRVACGLADSSEARC